MMLLSFHSWEYEYTVSFDWCWSGRPDDSGQSKMLHFNCKSIISTLCRFLGQIYPLCCQLLAELLSGVEAASSLLSLHGSYTRLENATQRHHCKVSQYLRALNHPQQTAGVVSVVL